MVLALTGVQIAFATWSIVGKVTVNVVPPVALVTFRLVGGALFFALIAKLTKRPLVPPREIRGEVAVLALTGLVANQILFTWGLRYTSAIESSVIGSTIPIFTVALAVFTGREHGHKWLWRGLALALAGALIVSRPQRLAGQGGHVVGNAMILVNSLSYSLYLVRGRFVMAKYGAYSVITWMFLFAAVMVAPFGVPAIVTHAASWSARTWLAVAYVVAIPTAFAYGANAFAMARAPSSLVAVFIYLQPVLTIAIAISAGDALATWLGVTPPHERLTMQLALGMACVLGGVALAARDRGTPRPSTS